MSKHCSDAHCMLHGCVNPNNCVEMESDSTPEGEAAYQQKRADDALDLLRQERDSWREERARRVRETISLQEEITHLRQGIDLFRSAYLAATAVRPGAKRREIEAWILEEQVREDRRRVDALPDYPDPGDR